MRRTILQGWYYDVMVEEKEARLRNVQKELADFEKDTVKFNQGLRKLDGIPLPPQAAKEATEIKDEYDRLSAADKTKLDGSLTSANMNLANLKSLHPFLIGPSTLEDLINNRPRSYEYMKEFKLPFDHMWFELLEPFDMKLPFTGLEVKLRGMSLQRIKPADQEMYGAKMYFVDKNKVRHSLGIDFSPDLQGVFTGLYLGDPRAAEDNDQSKYFIIEPDKSILRFTGMKHFRELLDESDEKPGTIDDFHRIMIAGIKIPSFREVLYPNSLNLNDVSNREVFFQLPNLCTNLVNYINAHNVTVVKRDREVIEIEVDERNKKKKRASKRPFYLITIKDAVYVEPDEPRYTGLWKLKERIFVRGHDRRYRDNLGNIIMTSWINPCIKGPPNAPFREQRYQVLYDKLQREKDMMTKYGVAMHYSSDLVMPGSSQGKKPGNV